MICTPVFESLLCFFSPQCLAGSLLKCQCRLVSQPPFQVNETPTGTGLYTIGHNFYCLTTFDCTRCINAPINVNPHRKPALSTGCIASPVRWSGDSGHNSVCNWNAIYTFLIVFMFSNFLSFDYCWHIGISYESPVQTLSRTRCGRAERYDHKLTAPWLHLEVFAALPTNGTCASLHSCMQSRRLCPYRFFDLHVTIAQ
jgi:hypothetical protein